MSFLFFPLLVLERKSNVLCYNSYWPIFSRVYYTYKMENIYFHRETEKMKCGKYGRRVFLFCFTFPYLLPCIQQTAQTALLLNSQFFMGFNKIVKEILTTIGWIYKYILKNCGIFADFCYRLKLNHKIIK